jgi:LPS export ABC transporter permease LptG
VYVGSRYVRVALVAFFGLLSLYYVGTLIDKSSKLFKGQADMAKMFEFFYYSTPQYVVHLVPMTVLVAVLATIGGLTRSGELIVMRACGVSLYRVAMPLFLLALVWSGGLFFVDDRVLARANQRAEVLDDEIRGNAPHTVSPVSNSNWLAGDHGAIYYYQAFDIPKKTLHRLSVFELADRASRMNSQTSVVRATFMDGQWQGENGWVQRFTGRDGSVREAFNRRVLDLPPPTDFSGVHNSEAALMNYRELSAHIGRLSASGFNLAESRVSLESRIAFPLVTIVMTLLGVPFGVTTGRRGALYGIGLAIILAAVYWLTNTVFVAFGQADLLPPMLAAWAANILFLAMAAYMTLTVRT